MIAFASRHLAAASCAVGAVLCAALAAPVQAQTASLDALVKAAQAEKIVSPYGSTPIEQVGAAYKGFEAKYGIEVRHFVASSSPLVTRFQAEAAAKSIQADFLSTSDTTMQVEHPEWFQKLTPENFPGYAEVPTEAKLPSGFGVSHAVAAFSMTYNTGKMNETSRPKTWQDLGDPKWKGQTILIDPRASATYRSAFNAISKLYPDLLLKMAATQPRLAESGVPGAQLLAAGTGTFAFITYESNSEALIAKGAPIRPAALQGPEFGRRQWIGVVAGPHPNAGRLLAHYMISIDGLKNYCAANKSNKTIIDRDGKQTGCSPLSADAQFLTEEPVSQADSARVNKALGLE